MGRQKANFWHPGDPLTEQDEQMLEQVREIYRRQGYVPTKKEVSCSGGLKKRFKIWNDVTDAAGLPRMHDPEQTRLRMEAAAKRKENETVSED